MHNSGETEECKSSDDFLDCGKDTYFEPIAGLDLASSPNETVKYNFSPTSWVDSAGKEIVDNFVNDPLPGDSYELHGYDSPVSRGKKISPKDPVSKLILAKQKQTRKEEFKK